MALDVIILTAFANTHREGNVRVLLLERWAEADCHDGVLSVEMKR